jgi:hypothetical protein
MNKKHACILILTSAILNSLIWFLDEKNYSLAFLTDLNEFGNWVAFVVLFAVLCLGIFAIANFIRARRYAFGLSFLGFSPLLFALYSYL